MSCMCVPVAPPSVSKGAPAPTAHSQPAVDASSGRDARVTTRASPQEVADATNAAARALGAPYDAYSCKQVSWDDVARSTTSSGALSCVGPNIVDTRLHSRSGEPLWTLRGPNWNERLGKTSASGIGLVVGSHVFGGVLRPVTLETFLKSAGEFGAYAGLSRDANLYAPGLDDAVSVRMQVVFLPLPSESAPASASAPAFSAGATAPTLPTPSSAALEFVTEAYSYQTHTASQPRSMILLCTSQVCSSRSVCCLCRERRLATRVSRCAVSHAHDARSLLCRVPRSILATWVARNSFITLLTLPRLWARTGWRQSARATASEARKRRPTKRLHQQLCAERRWRASLVSQVWVRASMR